MTSDIHIAKQKEIGNKKEIQPSLEPQWMEDIITKLLDFVQIHLRNHMYL